MARPLKDGVDYFPLDVGFLADDKVKFLRWEFGAKGVVVWMVLMCRIYGENGYYIAWADDSCFMMSDGVGCGCTPEFVGEVVQGCLRRSLFDQGVYKAFGVLTSHGIQQRYIRMISKRDEIRMIKDYFLLDMGNPKDVPKSILNKVVLIAVSGTRNLDKTGRNPDKTGNNPQSKVKESIYITPSSSIPAGEDDDEEDEVITPFGPVKVDHGWQRVCTHYMDNLGNLPMGIALDDLQQLYDELGEALVKKGIEEAARSQPKYPLRWLCTTLRRWQADGIKTEVQANAQILSFKRAIQVAIPSQGRTAPDYDPYQGYERLE